MGARLDLPDADQGTYAPVLDPDQQWPGRAETSSRHRVKNNLPGTPAFCPLVFRTPVLDEFAALDLVSRARRAVADVPKDVLSRAAAFLLLEDSRSTYAIEGERPPPDRIQRWGRATGEAGKRPVDLDERLPLQALVNCHFRSVQLRMRPGGGFPSQPNPPPPIPIPP